jgi:hypothetical protein
VHVGKPLFGSLRVSRFVGSISSPLTEEGVDAEEPLKLDFRTFRNARTG